MGRPPPILDLRQLREVLTAFLDHTMPACAEIEYRLVGTGAALLHGVAMPAADIDILVRERRSVDAFGSALASFRCLEPPAWLPETQQYYGNYEISGVEVGISTVEVPSEADTIETFGRGPWERFTLLACGPYRVPTVALELRLITELYRDRPDRYEPIIGHLQLTGCDIDFIRRGLHALGLAPEVQEDVLGRLRARAPELPAAGNAGQAAAQPS
jgi:hypothetical protein